MAEFVVLRIHPREPMAPADFTLLLQGLSITAYDLSFAKDPRKLGTVDGPQQLGVASGLADPHLPSITNNNVNVGNTAIMQHYVDVPPPISPPPKVRKLESVATAVIVVTPPSGGEYPAARSYDLLLEIKRNAQPLGRRRLEYNVPVTVKASLPTSQKTYFAMEASAYVELPGGVGLDPNLASVDLPADGQPPGFGPLCVAIDKVLAKDPGGSADLEQRSPLSAVEAQHIAAEIVWNREAEPPPALLDVAIDDFGALYTKPPAESGLVQDDLDKARFKFEGELDGYYGTRQAAELRLAGFVFSASAAIAAEKLSREATRARLDFPVLTGSAVAETTISRASVALAQVGTLTSSFVVPAAFFYALTANVPPQVGFEQRYDMARFDREERLLTEFQVAYDAGTIEVPAAPFAGGGAAIDADQAARRLHSLGAALSSLTEIAPNANVAGIVDDWLTHAGLTADIDADFWEPAKTADEGAYLDLLLAVITKDHSALIAALKALPPDLDDVAELVAITDEGWRDLFLGPAPHTGPYQLALLPPFTEPGTPQERTEAFIRHLRKFFAVPSALPGAPTPGAGIPPGLGISAADVMAAFEVAYNAIAPTPLDFATPPPPDPAHVRAAAAAVFPSDSAAQEWLVQAIAAIAALYDLTSIGTGEQQFSLIEALYARGFTSRESVAALTVADFAYALTGTVAYEHAAAIHARAGGGPAAVPPPGPFAPVNPDGSLTDCVPPAHLSPLGPVAYLHELLAASAASTCAEPLQPKDEDRLESLLAGRRGPLGDLHATAANLQTPLLVIDLVNESLESLVDGLAGGATGGTVHDTAADELAGHRLAAPDAEAGGEPFAHKAQTLFGVVPEHSSPSTPVAAPGAYDLLRADFTAPELPYPQALDVSRSYLEELGTTRFATMRCFRKEITELATDAEHEPAGFLSHLWRFPVRLEIALEYLRISPEEHELLYTHDVVTVPTPGRLLLRELYGFPSDVVNGRPWTDIVVSLPELLRRTGLAYCDFLDLWRSGLAGFGPAEDGQPAPLADRPRRAEREGRDQPPRDDSAPRPEPAGFPDCEPCCLDDLAIAFDGDPTVGLHKLAVYVRLWRRLRTLREPRLGFAELRDLDEVLHLFEGDSINPDFIRQLAALLLLRDLFCLPLADPEDESPEAIGADRTHLLALWVGPDAAKWEWAVATLLDQLENIADALERGRRGPERKKTLAENLDPLSVLAGFDPATPELTWHAKPTSTLRFAEALWKITVSDFTVGDILFLFTVRDHLFGDDPFALQPQNESFDDPFQHPDDQPELGLWGLRRKLLEVEVDAGEAEAWTWARMVAALRDDFGLPPGPTGLDRLVALGERFFPSVLEREGHPVVPAARRFSVPLAAASTRPQMWNTPPDGPFRYDLTAEELWAQLPVRDAAVAEKLSEIRTLSAVEQDAVRDLYFAPRAMLAQFSLLFWNFDRTADRLIHEPDEEERFVTFQRGFARFERRCRTIAEHLAEHVAAATGREHAGTASAAWRLLRQLWGDENRGTATWEDDSGEPPAVTWPAQPTGGAFAALLGLAGTGVLCEMAVEGTDPAWRELRGPLSGFGGARNHWNAPVPTVIPAMGLTLTPDQQRHAAVRNGFALRHRDGEPLFGAQPFRARWRGALLVERPGEYRFEAGAPTGLGESPQFEDAEDKRWLVTVRRGQRRWYLLNHDWPAEEAPASSSDPLHLRRGAYEIEVLLEQPEPTFARPEDICPRHAGFQVKYTGPDSDDALVAIPFDRLFRLSADEPLSEGIEAGEAANRSLRERYTSSLRDIRRTYQRAFKAVFFAHLFQLSAEPLEDDPQSELDYLLDHAAEFAGRSYPRTAPNTFKTHRAWLDPNLLPVSDPHGPAPAGDERAQPSAMRQAALFDWWERIFDYDELRRETAGARDRPAWRLFYEATDRQPDDPAQLLRHLGADIRHSAAVDPGDVPILLTYYEGPGEYTLQTGDLESEPWAIRAWQGEKWLRALEQRFLPRWIGAARPARWAADDPGASSGNANLTDFVRDGCFECGEPRRYANVKTLNDGLRERARSALVAYLCGMDRVALPYAPGHFAREARDLSDLLLQDVEAGVCERASRIEEAVSAVQAFVQRARLGLEPSLPVTQAFVEVWDGRFATFHAWRCCRQREVYRENWIEWDELEKARRVEAFRFLEEELRAATLTVAAPGGLIWWNGARPPAHPCLQLLQERDQSQLRLLGPGPEPENLDLMGAPEHHATPAWLAPLDRGRDGGVDRPRDPERPRDEETPGVPPSGEQPADNVPRALLVTDRARQPRGEVPSPDELARLPLWIQAAVRLGARFVRVAAAGVPPAAKAYRPCDGDLPCCEECGAAHEPLVDEYWFWLVDTLRFDALVQEADAGLANGGGPNGGTGISGWHDPTKLPGLLAWPAQPMVHLHWSRLHDGELQPPRRSAEGVPIDAARLTAGELPQLDFMGRSGDSLRFEVSDAAIPIGHADPTPPGFRYDLATDAAVVLPLVGAPVAVAPTYTGGLPVYPYFAYHCPGAPVEPLSPFSVAIAVGGALRARCHFEAALKWYELAYDPLERDDEWAPCHDRVPTDPEPVEDRPPEPVEGDQPVGVVVLVEGSGESSTRGEQPAEGERGEQPPIAVRGVTRPTEGRRRPPRERRRGGDVACCAQEARDDGVARERAVLLHYLETLLQWGDALMCRNSPEALRQAGVVFDTLDRILGEHPKTVLAVDDPGDPPTISAFQARPASLNPRLMALYERTADRRDLIHACLNAYRLPNGRAKLDMPYFGDDPMREGWRCEVCGCCDCGGCVACCDAYRFGFRLQKALELAGEVRTLGSALLAAFEKHDAEHLVALRAGHERQLLELALDVRKHQWREADWQVQALQKTKEGAQTRLRYYQTLIANGLNAGEIGYTALTGVSMASRTAGNVLEAIAQGMGIVPDMWLGVAGIAGTPLQFNQLPVGNKLAQSFVTAARILNALAEIASTGAGLSLTQGGWDRREDEWRHQVEVISIEIEQIERQILASERRRDAALRELNNHQRQIENAVAVQDFLRDKFTNEELYLFLQRETAAIYYQLYELARVAARQAERSFNYERGHTARSFVPDAAWDDLHEGLLAGERLQLSLRQMEKAYLDENCREYELTKHISLRLGFPIAFLQLRTTGRCEIELPEWIFDLDYPGHYMRRIRNVTLSIPAVVGPYTGVHCRLTLLSSTTRVDPRLRAPAVECCGPDCDCEPGNSCCCCEPAPNGYETRTDDPRIVRAYAATEAIATSSGQNDSGMFELNFRDDRYLPFEFAGAVSRWRIELPPETNFFDFDTLSDVVLHLNYTAREGGELLRAAAADQARCRLPGDGLRLLDVRRDLPDAWNELQHRREDHHHAGWSRRLPLRWSEAMFPFVPTRRVRWIDAVQVLVEAPGAEPSANHVARFFPGVHRHDHHEHCHCDSDDFALVASDERPGLYWGVVDLRGRRLGPLERDGATELGTIELPDALGEVCEVHLVARYCADPWPRCGEPSDAGPCDAGPADVGARVREPRRGG